MIIKINTVEVRAVTNFQQEASWLQPFQMRKVSFLLCNLFIGVAWHFIEYTVNTNLSHIIFFCGVFCNSVMQLESITLSFE